SQECRAKSPLREHGMSHARFGWMTALARHGALAVAFALCAGSACHNTDSGSGVAAPDAGASGGTDGGTTLNIGDPDAAGGSEAGAVSAGPSECAEHAPRGRPLRGNALEQRLRTRLRDRSTRAPVVDPNARPCDRRSALRLADSIRRPGFQSASSPAP